VVFRIYNKICIVKHKAAGTIRDGLSCASGKAHRNHDRSKLRGIDKVAVLGWLHHFYYRRAA